MRIAGNGTVIALNAKTGALIRSYPTHSDWVLATKIDNVVYCASQRHKISANFSSVSLLNSHSKLHRLRGFECCAVNAS